MDASAPIAAAAGLLGVGIGGWLTGRQQRSAQLREPMLRIAVDYVEALRRAVPDAPGEPRKGSVEARVQLSRAFTLSHRALLIYGPDTPAGEQGIEAYFATLTAFDHAEEPLDVEERLVDGEQTARKIWLGEHRQIEFEAERAVRRFAVVAGRAIRTGGRHPWLDRGRRFRRWAFRSPARRRSDRRLRSLATRMRVADQALKEYDADLRRVLDQAEADGVEMPVDLDDLSRDLDG